MAGQEITGRLVQWDPAKGYGFIRPEGGGDKLFVHATAWLPRVMPPAVGERVAYRRVQLADGCWRAAQVRCLSAPRRPAQAEAGAARSAQGRALLWLIPGFAALVLAVQLHWPLPHGLWGLYMAMSLASFIVLWLDKRAARRQQWRVPEWQLLALALACGWPGVLLAQQLLRHKSSKPTFIWRFHGALGLNVFLFLWLFTPLRSWMGMG